MSEYELNSTSPTGQYEIRIRPYEPRMSLWVYPPHIYDVVAKKVLFYFKNENWSLDTSTWLSATVVTLVLRKYPGDQVRSVVEVSIDCAARSANVNGMQLSAFDQIEGLLETLLNTKPDEVDPLCLPKKP
jgi:hypothetical protein